MISVWEALEKEKVRKIIEEEMCCECHIFVLPKGVKCRYCMVKKRLRL